MGEQAEESLFRTEAGQRYTQREGVAVLDEEPGKRRWRPSARTVLPGLFAFANYPVSSSHPTGVWTRPNMRATKRKQPTRGEMFAKKDVDKETIYKICRLLFQLNLKKANNQIGKWAKDLHGNFSQEGIRTDIKPVQTGSASLL